MGWNLKPPTSFNFTFWQLVSGSGCRHLGRLRLELIFLLISAPTLLLVRGPRCRSGEMMSDWVGLEESQPSKGIFPHEVHPGRLTWNQPNQTNWKGKSSSKSSFSGSMLIFRGVKIVCALNSIVQNNAPCFFLPQRDLTKARRSNYHIKWPPSVTWCFFSAVLKKSANYLHHLGCLKPCD